MPDTQQFEYKAEVKKLLDILVHSVYSSKDVFIRELVSNAADALEALPQVSRILWLESIPGLNLFGLPESLVSQEGVFGGFTFPEATVEENPTIIGLTSESVYSVQTEGYDIEDKMSLIAREVAEIGELRFSMLMHRAQARMEIIVSFMALLELIKLGRVICTQDANFSDILILPRLPEERIPDAPAEPALGS